MPPNKGRWQSTGKVAETIDVTVRSEALTSMPPELAAERLQSIGIPTYPTGSAIHREMAEAPGGRPAAAVGVLSSELRVLSYEV